MKEQSDSSKEEMMGNIMKQLKHIEKYRRIILVPLSLTMAGMFLSGCKDYQEGDYEPPALAYQGRRRGWSGR